MIVNFEHLFNVDSVFKEHVGPVGLFQVFLAIACGLSTVPAHIITVFIMGPPEFRCLLDNTTELSLQKSSFEEASSLVGPSKYSHVKHPILDKNMYGCFKYSAFNDSYSQLERCDSYVYKIPSIYYQSSIIANWNLVCENSWKVPFSSTIYLIGMMFGFIFGGQIGGFFGIRRTLLFFTYSFAASTMMLSLCYNYLMFLLIRLWSSFSISGTMTLFFLLLNEMTLCQYRSLFMAISYFCSEFINHLLMVKVASDVSDWRLFNFYICLLSLICLLYPIILPESPRWLVSQHRPNEAMEILYKSFRLNNALMFFSRKSPDGKKISEKFFMEKLKMSNPLPRYFTFTRQPQLDDKQATELTKTTLPKNKVSNFKNILTDPHTLLLLLKCTILYTFQILIYFGIILYARVMRGSIYFSVTLYAIAAVISTIMSFLVYRIFRSRKKPIICFYALILFTMLSTATYLVIVKPLNDLALVIGANISYIFTMTVHTILFIYVAELFPSDFRAQAIGLASGLGRIGASVCDFINELDTKVLHGLPLFVYSALLLVQLGIFFTLKDITGENLKDFTTTSRNLYVNPAEQVENDVEI